MEPETLQARCFRQIAPRGADGLLGLREVDNLTFAGREDVMIRRAPAQQFRTLPESGEGFQRIRVQGDTSVPGCRLRTSNLNDAGEEVRIRPLKVQQFHLPASRAYGDNGGAIRNQP